MTPLLRTHSADPVKETNLLDTDLIILLATRDSLSSTQIAHYAPAPQSTKKEKLLHTNSFDIG
jgi:hypothetical protein